ncbi:acetyl-CoA synthetase [Candidatus Micrarchaeota archaeon CG10_big_fil_rev_8_21_14_0_10_45_29]|nr:MAG: acetyl-CoA synthetase [Candidatus Micrarchaeota archaeon CG10_big_fil_rev_8_21_14_0_10_45_29]
MASKTGQNSTMDFTLLSKYNIPCLPFAFAKNAQDACMHAKKIGFPVALKLISSKVLHKSEHHALSLNLKDEYSVKKEYARLQKLTPPHDPILVQKFSPSTIELIAGGKMDSQFGPTIMVGLGGIYTEILKDVSIRICPAQERDIRSMIAQLKSFPVLKGARGQSGISLSQLAKILHSLSLLMEKEQPAEIDINPLLLTSDGLVAADVRVLW